jgi:hypothetical protein
MENEQAGKIKQLVKEFDKTIAEKEKEFEKTFSNALGNVTSILL